MHRRTAAVALVATALAVTSLPAEAAKKKPKPKPIKGSYTLNLPPDPSKEVGSATGEPGCSGLSPASKDAHAFTVPAAGFLQVDLDGNAGATDTPAGLDWDLYLMDADGEIASSAGATGNESVLVSFKRKTAVTIDVCNLDGLPMAGVSFTFTYK